MLRTTTVRVCSTALRSLARCEETMTLLEAIRDIRKWDEDSTVYAAESWAADSQVIVMPEPESGGLPKEAQRLGLSYFLEVHIARDFLEDWLGALSTQPTEEQTCERLIQYALTDA